MVSKQIELEPSSAHWPMTALGSSASCGLGAMGLVELFDVAEEGVDVLDAEAGDDALPADAAVEAWWRYWRSATSRSVRAAKSQWPPSEADRGVALAVPDEEGLAEAGAGGDEAAMAGGGGVAGVEGEDFVGSELGDAVAVGFEIVDKEDVLDAERL